MSLKYISEGIEDFPVFFCRVCIILRFVRKEIPVE